MMQLSIFFNHLDFQVIEVNFLNKRILAEACFGMAAEIIDIAVEPDWFAEVELHADLLQRVENLMGSGFFAVVADDGIV
jgi:hypothetical protein